MIGVNEWRVGPRNSPESTRDSGSATVWVLAVGLVFALLAMAVAVAGAAVLARHRAQSAADLAALAAAMVALDGEQAACARAEDLSSRNGAKLVACRLERLDAVVTVAVAAGVGGRAGVAQASARAGPVDSDPVLPQTAAADPGRSG